MGVALPDSFSQCVASNLHSGVIGLESSRVEIMNTKRVGDLQQSNDRESYIIQKSLQVVEKLTGYSSVYFTPRGVIIMYNVTHGGGVVLQSSNPAFAGLHCHGQTSCVLRL